MKLIAWDFDGVLNQGFQGGFHLWQQGFEADLGVSAQVFTEFIFAPGQFDAVLTGKRDLLDLLGDWIAAHQVPLKAEVVLDYWLAKDAHLDDQVLGWLTACGIPGVIATNNEAHRAGYIWNIMGLRHKLQRIFASGPLGVKKPAAPFFQAIEAWSGLPPDEILLIDDAEKNIVAARALGWQVFHFTETSRDQLPDLIGLTL